MVPTRLLAVCIGAVLALGAPAGASAQEAANDLAPPVDPATEQYIEETPGDRTPRRLSDRDRRDIERDGGDGAALVTAVEGTAPPSAGSPAGAAPTGARGPAPADRSSAAPVAVPATIDPPSPAGDASLGPVAVWFVLAALAVAGSAVAVRRWRRTS